MQRHTLKLNYQLIFVYIFAFMALVLFQLGLLAFLDFEGYSPLQQATFGALMNVLLYGALTGTFFIMANIYLFKNQWLYFKERPLFSWAMIGFGMYLIVAVLILINGIFQIAGEVQDPQNQELINAILRSAWYNGVMVFTFAVVFAPIVEELVFRKAIFGIIYVKFGAVAAILGNSFIFAMIHITGEFSAWITGAIRFYELGLVVLPYLAMSIVISYIYYYSGKLIWVAIIVHMIINFISIVSNLVI